MKVMNFLKNVSLVCCIGSTFVMSDVMAGFFNLACSASSCGTKAGLAACLKSQSQYNTIDDIRNGGDKNCANAVQANCQNNPNYYNVPSLPGINSSVLSRLQNICGGGDDNSGGNTSSGTCADESCGSVTACLKAFRNGTDISQGCKDEIKASQYCTYRSNKATCAQL